MTPFSPIDFFAYLYDNIYVLLLRRTYFIEGCGNVSKSKVDVVLGTFYGDEGKGKIIDYLATKSDAVSYTHLRAHETGT